MQTFNQIGETSASSPKSPMLQHAHFDGKGGKQPFAAGAKRTRILPKAAVRTQLIALSGSISVSF